MAAGGGGAWKVAYADFVTAMMAFFMVMWLTAQKPDVKEAVAQYFQHPDPFDLEPDPDAGPSGSGGGSGSGHERKSGKASNDKQKPSPSNRPDAKEDKKPRVPLPKPDEVLAPGTVIYFKGNSVELDDDAKALLDRFAPNFTGKPNKLEVRGHATRSRAANSDPWDLSYKRCIATMNYLNGQGVEEKRMRLSQAGPNERLTLKVDGTEDRTNPRVEVIVLGEWGDDRNGTAAEREQRFQDEAGENKPEEAASNTKETPTVPVGTKAKPEAGAQTTQRSVNSKAG